MEAVRPKPKKKKAGRAKPREGSKKKEDSAATVAEAESTVPLNADTGTKKSETANHIEDVPKAKEPAESTARTEHVQEQPKAEKPAELATQINEAEQPAESTSRTEHVHKTEESASLPTQEQPKESVTASAPPAERVQSDSKLAEQKVASQDFRTSSTSAGAEINNTGSRTKSETTMKVVQAETPKVSTPQLPPTEVEGSKVDPPVGQSSPGLMNTVAQSIAVAAAPISTSIVDQPKGQSASGITEAIRDQGAEVISERSLGQSSEVVMSVVPSAPALIDLSEPQEVVSTATAERGGAVREYQVIYPKLDSYIEEGEVFDQLTPYTDEDMALLYPNPQLDANHTFIDNFVRNRNVEGHELYSLLMTYLKAKQALTNATNQVQELRRKCAAHEKLMWQFQTKEISETGRCGDNTKVSHNYTHRVGEFHSEEAHTVTTTLKETRGLLAEEVCECSYSSQLAKLHVEHHLYLLMHSVPAVAAMSPDTPISCWIPQCPPGSLDPYCSRLRDSVSVLFMFERRPMVDKEFSQDCRHWLNRLVSVLLRVSSLPDHQFLLNHLLRCPAGVGQWASSFLQVPSPLHSKQLLHTQFSNNQHRENGTGSLHSENWGVGLGLHGDWGGPILDHFMAMLATLLLPISVPSSGESPKLPRQPSTNWTFIDEDVDGGAPKASSSDMLLEENDYIAFFEQFPFNDLFRYILQFNSPGDYKVEEVSSHQILRLLAFSTCLVRLLGTAFTTLRRANYKEFLKQIGQRIRNTVSFVADHWSGYRSYRLQCGDSPSAIPLDSRGSGSSHSLNRLQLEFDQFVMSAIRWILIADKLGVWQFLADLPYDHISLDTAWKIFWTVYCKQSSQGMSLGSRSAGGRTASCHDNLGGGEEEEEGPLLACLSPDHSPKSVQEIKEALKGGSYQEEFVDRLMRTYTSEAVFLLTTLVNMARSRSCDSRTGSCDAAKEEEFIKTIVLEIFECTHVAEYARDTYSKTGAHLLGSIAIVHPFTISALLDRADTAVSSVGESVILLFKELPLHLWAPRSRDMQLVYGWLLDYQLTSSESNLARVILSSLNWGTRTHDGSNTLVLPWSLHCSTALKLVEAHARHLSAHPGGRDYNPSSSNTTLGKLATRITTTLSQMEFVKWSWDVLLMLKLHPQQVITHTVHTLSPSHSDHPGGGALEESGDLCPPPWVRVLEGGSVDLPNLNRSDDGDLAELRDAVNNEGLLAYYVAMAITDIATDTDQVVRQGLPMLTKLLGEGYHLTVLRVLWNVLPGFFMHSKALLENSAFTELILTLSRADTENASLKEKWVTGTTPLITKKLSALIQTQLERASSPTSRDGGSEAVLKFWLHLVLGCPNWHKEKSLLLLLDTLCMAAFSRGNWSEIVQETLLEAYQILSPTQPKKGLISSVYSSVTSVIWHDDTPSLFNAIPHEECPWLAYDALAAEQRFEEDEKIWRTLLSRLKKDGKISVDSALKKSFSELKYHGSFGSSHLCIYRWAGLCTTLSHAHPLYPLVWQRFFTLYLARPSDSDSSSTSQNKESYGHRFFSTAAGTTQLRGMKASLSSCCKQLKTNIAALDTPEWAETVGVANPSDEQRDTLRSFLPKCLKFYQTLRLWLEEPRLHGSSLYLPALPPQYDSSRLTSILQGNRSPWVEFVPMWQIRAELNSLVKDWIELAAYQKPLRSHAHSYANSNNNHAAERIQNRLQKSSSSQPPPLFSYCHAPFSPLPQNVLLSKEILTNSVCDDMRYLVQEAKSFTTHVHTLDLLDEDYMTGVPELYINEPRQFHVRVPCRSRFNRSHECSLPATIVFRFNEATSNAKWEGQLKANRVDYETHVKALILPVTLDLVQKVVRLEHTVAELSKLANQSQAESTSNNVPLQNGVTLFYEILPFIRTETRQFPPTNQFLTTCLQILGQAFIQQDPNQTSNILQLLISEYGKSDILAPLFHPNLCPNQFVEMYGMSMQMCEKEGPTVALSVLTKFNVQSWLVTYDPNTAECEQLMDYVFCGLNLCGPRPSGNHEILLEVYRRHFLCLIDRGYPMYYPKALRSLLSGTESKRVCLSAWEDLCRVIKSPSSDPQHGGGDSAPSYSCTLGLQHVHDSLDLLYNTYCSLRVNHRRSAYALIGSDYVPLIGLFLRQLCLGMISKWAEDVSMETAKSSQALNACWRYTVTAFDPWIASISPADSSNPVLFPCEENECGFMKDMMDLFVECVMFMHTRLQDPHCDEDVMSLLWTLYKGTMTRPQTPHYILTIYHSSLQTLPWSTFTPDLSALDSMMKLKMDERVPLECFVFLGRIFPLFQWERIVQHYCLSSDASSLLQFHIMLLQLLIMLTSQRQVMERDDTGIPQLIHTAQNFHWHLLDSKVYVDVLNWQKGHCDPTSILHKGSRLSLSLRLLRAAAGFPSSTGARQQLNEETWEKRYALLQLMVELVSQATHRKDAQAHSYSECVSNLFQIAVDVCVHEPLERNSPHLVSLMQEILNLLNTCSSEKGEGLLGIMVDVLDQLPQAHLISLSTITAACHSLISFHYMAKIIEHAIHCHFRSIATPSPHPLQLQPNPSNGHGWRDPTDSLVPSDEVIPSLVESAVADCAVLLLNCLLLKELPRCMSLADEMRVCRKVLQWCTDIKPGPDDEAKLLLLWGKLFDLVNRQVQYNGNLGELVPLLTSLATLLLKFGADKASEGLLGVLGLGKKSPYSHRFRLIARSLGAFVQCQLPVDANGHVRLRTFPNAPGHVKDGVPKSQQASLASNPQYTVFPTKQNEQAYQGLEGLTGNKGYTQLSDQVTYAVEFVGSPAHCVVNCGQLLMWLSAGLYPQHRYLDALRVCYT